MVYDLRAMWLKVEFLTDAPEGEGSSKNGYSVAFLESATAPVAPTDKSVRISRVFPLLDEVSCQKNLSAGSIYFFEFANPFRVLGKIFQSDFADLKHRTYFSHGVCSVIIVCDNEQILNDFDSLDSGGLLKTASAWEKWELNNGIVEAATHEFSRSAPLVLKTLPSYENLSGPLRTIADEFTVAIKIVSSKRSALTQYEELIFKGLNDEACRFVEQLNYLHNPIGDPPDAFFVEDKEGLGDPMVRQILMGQITDRLIQINSALSYVSTQMYSGSVPILERRSLIRRNSLLGVGATIAALNRVVNYIASGFASINVPEVVVNRMSVAKPLNGLTYPATPNRQDWYLQDIDSLSGDEPADERVEKLAYFSSRYGFRESEYAITAAVTSISYGLSLGWSLMTITHEMLHSHVRILLNSILYMRRGSDSENFRRYYERYFEKVVKNREPSDYTMIDSVRELVFTYCCRTQTQGSITLAIPYDPDTKIPVPNTIEGFYTLLQSEFRNINEIFAHVLDLHYFYGGKRKHYIPLIWCSWAAVPHVNADLRQYVLRSLLVIASKIDSSPRQRWDQAVDEFKIILSNHANLIETNPLLGRLVEVLRDDKLLNSMYYPAFKNGLILVDLAMQVFHSKKIRSHFVDDNVTVERDESSLEDDYGYGLPDSFLDVPVEAPIAYLFSRTLKLLDGTADEETLERETAVTFLAMNSV